MMTYGIVVATRVECDEAEADRIAAAVKGYLDALLESRVRIESYDTVSAYRFDNPRHTGIMVNLHNDPMGVS